MSPTKNHTSPSLASHSCTSGNNTQLYLSPSGGGSTSNVNDPSSGGGSERSNSQKVARAKIQTLLKERLQKLGSIRTIEAWNICKEHWPYDTIAFHFRCIMHQMKTEGKADFIRNGLWFIYKK